LIHDFWLELGALGFDAVNGHFHFCGVGVEFTLDFGLEVTVYFVPAVCVFGEIVGVPSRDVAFDEFEPDFLVFFGELGG
jgi:hypothetical protein